MLIYNLNFSRVAKLIFLSIFFLFSFSLLTLGQGYVSEANGNWRKENGPINGPFLRKGQKLKAGVIIKRSSSGSKDSIRIFDSNATVVASCDAPCDSLVVPKTETLVSFVWCKVFGCNKETVFAQTSERRECANFDGIAVVNSEGVSNLSGGLELFTDKPSRLNLKFQRVVGDEIKEKEYDINPESPLISGLMPGTYDVVEGKTRSRFLILPDEVYKIEKVYFEEVKLKIRKWQSQGLSNCTIKTFIQSYVDYVAKKYKKQIKKAQRT